MGSQRVRHDRATKHTYFSVADRYYSKQLIGRVSTQYEIDAPDLETRILAVVDYISGMTDLYALDIYQKINGSALPAI